jgi:GxxExxY protein
MTRRKQNTDFTDQEGDMKGLLYEELTYRIRAVLLKVHNTLGPGFREETYKRAVLLELKKQKIEFCSERVFDVFYDDQRIDCFRLDIVVEEKVILELKAVDQLARIHESQLLSYLRASGWKVGLLVNFGQPSLQIIRRVF